MWSPYVTDHHFQLLSDRTGCVRKWMVTSLLLSSATGTLPFYLFHFDKQALIWWHISIILLLFCWLLTSALNASAHCPCAFNKYKAGDVTQSFVPLRFFCVWLLGWQDWLHCRVGHPRVIWLNVYACETLQSEDPNWLCSHMARW